MRFFKGAALAAAVMIVGVGTGSGAQAPISAAVPPPLSNREVKELMAAMMSQADTPAHKAALTDFARWSPLQTKRQFLIGKIMIPYDDPAPRSNPPKDMLVQAQVPIGGLNCKHRKICVRVSCDTGFDDVNKCTSHSYDCTDYTSGDC